jgi:uncharacterized LabA/DUF88 family protein
MRRVLFFVDGFNLYYALDDNPLYHCYKWLDLSQLMRCYVTKKDQIVDILYFTTYVTWSPGKMQRHMTLVRALQMRGVKVIFGEFRRRDRQCPACGTTYATFEEKQTDVNIAIQLLEGAISDRFDTAILVSGDSDLIPSVNAVKSTFPAKHVGVVIPIGRRAEELKTVCDFHMRMKEKHLRVSQFPDEIDVGDDEKLRRPASWR